MVCNLPKVVSTEGEPMAHTDDIAEPYTIAQVDHNDQWVVLHNDVEVVRGPFHDRQNAIDERDDLNMWAWGC